MIGAPPGMPMLGGPPMMPDSTLPLADVLGLTPPDPEEVEAATQQDDRTFKLPSDPGVAQQLAEEAIALWRERDERMDEDQYLWELHRPGTKKRQQQIWLTDNAVQLEKLASVLSKAEIIPDVAANTEDDRPAAQNIEDGCTWILDQWEQRHLQCVRAPLRYEVSLTAGLRGWAAAEIMLNPNDPSFPFGFRLLDPRQLYPDTDDGKPTFVVHKYTTKQRQLEAIFGRKAIRRALRYSNQEYSPLQGNRDLTCLAFYTDTETAILIENGRWLKKPMAHEYGFRPLVMIVGPGAPYRATDNLLSDTGSGTNEHVKYIGAGFLRTIKPATEDKQKLASMQRTVAAKTASPPVNVQAVPGADITKDDIATEVNEVAVLPVGTVVQPNPPPPAALQHTGALLSLTQDEINRAGFGPSTFGQGHGESGFAQQDARGTDMDVVDIWVEMYKAFWREALRCALRLFAKHGPPNMFFTALDPTTGYRTAGNRLQPGDVLGADYRLDVDLGDLGLHDKVAMGNLAGMLVDRGVLDHETALTDYLHHRNPTAIRKRAIRDQGYKDPMIMRLRNLQEMAKDPMDPDGAKLAQMLLQQEMAKFTLMASGQMGPGAGQGPPLPGSQMPSAALPDELSGNAGAGPNGVNLGPPQAGAGMQVPG